MRRVSTGIEGLDELIGGGFPEGRIILVVGGPGTGNTFITVQQSLERRVFLFPLMKPLKSLKIIWLFLALILINLKKRGKFQF